MKVKTLISYLQDMNPDADISLVNSEDICRSYISEDNATPLTTLQVFLEGCDCCEKCDFYDDGFCIVYEKDTCDVEECYQFEEKDNLLGEYYVKK